MAVAAGDQVQRGDLLVVIADVAPEPAPAPAVAPAAVPVPASEPGVAPPVAAPGTPPDEPAADPGAALRADLAEVVERHRFGLDEARPDAVAKRHQRGNRTARENLADLVDDGSYVEYGPWPSPPSAAGGPSTS